MSEPVTRWQPGASVSRLRQRATALSTARAFFAARGYLEVETPTLVAYPVSDPQLANVRCALDVRPGAPYYLHTSPEYHMKRLLAAGAPDIVQIGKVFRDGELGARHLPEFTLAEWYRRGATYAAFIEEACELIRAVGASLGRDIGTARHIAYADLFLEVTSLDPLVAPLERLRERAAALVPGGVSAELARTLGNDREGWLDLLLVGVVEPALSARGLVVVDRYPAAQAALARLAPDDARVAERFEIYLDGLELANGYHELGDAGEQRRRFENDRARRREQGLADTPADSALLAALERGLPDCCGVALGFDRLLMACLGVSDIREVVSFAAPEGP